MIEVFNKSLCIFVSSSPALYLCLRASFVGKHRFGDFFKNIFIFVIAFFLHTVFWFFGLWVLTELQVGCSELSWYGKGIWGKGNANPDQTTHAPGFPDQIHPESVTYAQYLDAQIQQLLQRWLLKNNSAGAISTLCFLHNSWVVWAFCGRGEVVCIPRLYCTY